MSSFVDTFDDQENRGPVAGPGGRPIGRVGPASSKVFQEAVAAAQVLVASRPVLGEISQNVNSIRTTIHHTGRFSKQPASFSIYCDDGAGVGKQKSSDVSKSSSVRPETYVDKENVLPTNVPTKVPRGRQGGSGEVTLRTHHTYGQSAPLRTNHQTGGETTSLRSQNTFGEAVAALRTQLPVECESLSGPAPTSFSSLRSQQTLAGQFHPSLLLASQIESMNTSLASTNYDVEEESPMVVVESERDVPSTPEQWRVPPIQDNQTVDIFSEPEYFQDIYNYLKESEGKHLPKWNYMSKQNDITHPMRAILVDWLVEVSEEYKLQTETLYLAISYIDRFLSLMAVQRSKLQLVGTACMFIAAKYEEIYPPDVSEFVYITDDTYNKRQVLRMEHLVLKVLGFDLSVPTAHVFVNKMVQMVSGTEKEERDKVTSLALYLSELSLVDGENCLQFPPSMVAAGAVCLARHTLCLEAWPEELETQTEYSVDDLKECLLALHSCFIAAETSSQQAVREKYKATKHHNVSELTPPSLE